MELTAKIEQEILSEGEPVYVALCVELDIASQGATVEEARDNLIEAVAAFMESASPSELARRLPSQGKPSVFTTKIEVPLGKTSGLIGAGSL